MRRVLYTVLIGDYDTLRDPEATEEGWDYVCFSNHLKQDDFSTWIIRPLDRDGLSDIEASRFPKLCPHTVLPDYDTSVYIDSNIVVKTDFIYRRAEELEIRNENLISVPVHPTRDCLYEEAEILKYRGKDNTKSIDEQIDFLKAEGFPKKYGLFENNVIWRRHLHEKIVKLNEEWWSIYQRYSKRDQLGLAYCLWKYDIICVPLMPESIADHRKCEHFEFTKHNLSLFSPMKRWKTKFSYILKNRKRPKFIKN